MSTEEGTITKVSDNKAWVKVRRSAMCDACSCKSACSILGSGETMEAEALNTANGQIGDRVLLKIPTSALWKISFILYMVPVIFLISGVIIGMKLARNYAVEPELGALLLGVTGCILSFFPIKLFSHHVRKNKEYTPEIVKVISTS
ncbi:MAG: SoxR reducing system RseC family protein [Candidatus Aminicenantes bacterium]|nr:MAG: SoxR reducing system RseC family protein [Candidatus Aminicenantes bacterium]